MLFHPALQEMMQGLEKTTEYVTGRDRRQTSWTDRMCVELTVGPD